MPVTRTPMSAKEARRLEEELRKTWDPTFARDKRMRNLINRKNKVELLPETLDLNVEPVELHTGRAGSLIDHAQTFAGSSSRRRASLADIGVLVTGIDTLH